MKIGIDIDGICRDMVTPAIQIYKKDYDEFSDITYNKWTKWAMKDNLPKVEKDYEFFYKYAKQLFLFAPMYDNVKFTLNEIKHSGHTIAIVTHQLPGLEKYTLNWLRKNRLPYDSLHFTKDKSIVKLDLLVDDGIHNLEKVQHPLCLDRPWNQEYKGPRIKSLEEMLKYLH